MEIFWPVTVQLPSAASSPRQRRAAMSEPASGSVMSMLPQDSPARMLSITSRKRTSVKPGSSGSKPAEPSMIENISAAMAIPPWKPWWAQIDTSARAKISFWTWKISIGTFRPPSSRGRVIPLSSRSLRASNTPCIASG